MQENPRIFFERLLLSLLIVASFGATFAALLAVLFQPGIAGSLFATANALFLLSGLMQAEVSGWLSRVTAQYGEAEFGPPSFEMRRMFILYSPDNPLSRWWGDWAFFEERTAFWLVFIGTVLAIPSAWL